MHCQHDHPLQARLGNQPARLAKHVFMNELCSLGSCLILGYRQGLVVVIMPLFVWIREDHFT